jgi:putative ABC transport system ATP-binding protein
VIEVKNVTKRYGKKQNVFTALKDVNFKVPDGATVAIIGKSGSGKSTLMHVMSGLDHPDAGEVVINGQVLHKLKRRAMDKFRSEEMSFIFQAFFVEGNQTAYQNVALPLEIVELPRRKRNALIREALEQVELLDKAGSRARNLSGGQKQRLAIARAIVNKPQLIFADEPTGNLDSVTGDKVIGQLFNLNKTLGITVIIVTHDHELAARCQLQISLKDGEIVSVKDSTASKKSPKAKV